MSALKTVMLVSCSSLALAACGGGGGGGTGGGTSSPTPPPPVIRSYSFPAGDATASSGATAWDIVGVTTTLTGQFGNSGGNSYDTLRVAVTFAQNVADAFPAPGQMLSSGSQLGIAIALDTDGNPATGITSDCAPGAIKPFEYQSDPGTDPGRLLGWQLLDSYG